MSSPAGERPLTICAIGYATSIHVANRVRCFAARGHRVFLITEVRSAEGIDGVTELVPAPPQGRYARLLVRALDWLSRKFTRIRADDVWRAVSFVSLVRQCRPDIVHVHYAYAYYAWLAGVLGCRPLVVSVMGGDVLYAEQGNPSEVGIWLTKLVFRSADYITSKSDFLTKELDRLGGFGAKADRIVWGVDLAVFRRVDATRLRHELRLTPGQTVILSPKILQSFYRIELIIEAMVAVRRVVPDAVLLITEYNADPEYKGRLRALADSAGLSAAVRFCGHVANADMASYYSLADVAIAVPPSDGLPQTLLEAMACETPNILTRLDRYEEIVRDEESCLFTDATPDAIAATIVRLLGDPALRDSIVRTGASIVRENADFWRQVTQVETRYRALAARIRPRTFRLQSVLFAARHFRAARPTPK